jgi:hypothetical protein
MQGHGFPTDALERHVIPLMNHVLIQGFEVGKALLGKLSAHPQFNRSFNGSVTCGLTMAVFARHAANSQTPSIYGTV